MRQLSNITSDSIQEHLLEIGETITFTLRFLPPASIWVFDVLYKDRRINGVKLSLGVLHLKSHNLPFDFVIEDTSNSGIDPFKKDDFLSGRILINLLTQDELEMLRGYPVEI